MVPSQLRARPQSQISNQIRGRVKATATYERTP